MLEHEDELICDFAQFYHILDWRALPLRRAAVLACGLPADSRIMRKLSGSSLSPMETMVAGCVDRLSMMVWMNSRDGQKNRNRPPSILSELNKKNEKPMSFSSAAAFENARNQILKG